MITDNLRDIGFDVSMNISSALKLSLPTQILPKLRYQEESIDTLSFEVC